jgi:MFS family permease
MIIPALFIAQIGMRQGSCVIICDVSLNPREMATGKALCEGLGSIPSIFAPIIAAFIITFFGGIAIEGIRPLYWIQFIFRCVMFLFLATQLKEVIRPGTSIKKSNFVEDFRRLFEGGTAMKRWIIFSTLGMFTINMMTPFRFPFAHEIKGAEQFIIGGMTTARIIVRVLFSTPLGRLADRIGQKKVFYILTPLVCISNLLLVFAPTQEILLISGFLLGFDMISRIVVVGSMTPKLVPIEYIGRWRGILGLFGGLASILAPFIGGIIWENLGPTYVFLIPIILDLLVRIPIIASISK